MIPNERLAQLLKQAIQWQISQCRYHNIQDFPYSLYKDHQCDASQLPTVTTHILSGHLDEIWYMAFSNTGKWLASCSKDKTAIIWNVQVFFSMVG